MYPKAQRGWRLTSPTITFSVPERDRAPYWLIDRALDHEMCISINNKKKKYGDPRGWGTYHTILETATIYNPWTAVVELQCSLHSVISDLVL